MQWPNKKRKEEEAIKGGTNNRPLLNPKKHKEISRRSGDGNRVSKSSEKKKRTEKKRVGWDQSLRLQRAAPVVDKKIERKVGKVQASQRLHTGRA